MKAEHRHELKTNELVEWLTNLPQWAKDNLITLITIAIVIAGAAGFYIWRIYTKNVVVAQKQQQFTTLLTQLMVNKMQILNAQADGRDVSFILLQPAEGLKNLAQNATTSQMAAFALIKRAEALRSELHYRINPVPPQELTSQIEQAKSSYAQAIEMASSSPSLLAAAKFGLGLCEEELGSFEKAGQIYREVSQDPNFGATVTAAAAKHRLETMADYKQRLAFRHAPTPIVPPKLPIERLPIDINLPSDINRTVEANKPVPIKIKLPDANQTTSVVVPDVNLAPQAPAPKPADSNGVSHPGDVPGKN